VKFPKKLKYRGRVLATIYGKNASGYYRLYWRVRADGKPRSRMRDFATYGEAKREGDKLVSDLAKGSQVTALTPGQANDALAALECLRGFYGATGRKVSLLASVSEYCEAAGKLGGRTLGEAVDGYLSNVATVRRVDLSAAVEEFLRMREAKTKAEDGKRPQLSPGYHYIVAMWLREFAKTLPGYAVCDLTKEPLNLYMAQHGDVSTRTRNGRRTVLGMFLKWCVRQDYLAANHRLLEADGMAQEGYEPESIEFYSPAELASLLEGAGKEPDYKGLVPVIALCGLAGLRLQEAVRLTWADVFHVAGHVEISKTKSKTRSRRLVAACPALAQWLEPYRVCEGPVWPDSLDFFHSRFGDLRESLGIPARRNGLRHGFVSYHFALHSNENLTAAEAGNSPAMIHAHYKGLATKKEAEQWFAVSPARPANIIPMGAAAPQTGNAAI
jgi:integrase